MKERRRPGRLAAGFARAAIIGLCGGLASLAFREATTGLQELIGATRNILEGARGMPWWQLVITPTIGALVAGLITMWVVRGASGTGLSDVMEAVSLKSGPIPFFSAMKRVVASMGIIATGGSVGREGPIITISAAASSALTKILRAPERDRGVLLGCGVAAGFASAYNAPIAGALFALEVVIGNFAVELFAPVVVASVTSTLFTWTFKDPGAALYSIHPSLFQRATPWEIVPYLALGAAR